MATPYLSEIKLFAFGFAPRNWALCAGQLLPINQNQALFSLLGTTYGGNGQTTFALPDLRGRVPVSMSSAVTGLQNYEIGGKAGAEAVTLAAANMPVHTHATDVTLLTASLPCKNGAANHRGAAGNTPAIEAAGVTAVYSSSAADGSASASAVVPTIVAASAGGGAPHDNVQPYTVLNYCIALTGIFPSQV